ncbi:MAG: formyltransferase family protein, partial [Bosea sp. (in: a-proteobacteria)]
MSSRRLRVAILISGGGSNMLALAKAAAEPGFPAEIRLVLSNRPDAGGLEKARAQGITAASVDHRFFGTDRETFEREIDKLLRI